MGKREAAIINYIFFKTTEGSGKFRWKERRHKKKKKKTNHLTLLQHLTHLTHYTDFDYQRG